MKTIVLICQFLIVYLLAAGPAVAQKTQKPPRLYLYPEYFLPAVSTSLRFDAPLQDLGVQTTLSLENDLGFDKTPATFRLQAITGEGSQVALSYLNISRRASTYLSRDVAFADTVYHAGANTLAYFIRRFLEQVGELPC